MTKDLELHATHGSDPAKAYNVILREYNCMDVDRTRLFSVSVKQALMIAGSHNNIFFRHAIPQIDEPVEPQRLVIEKVPDREPLTRPWNLYIGGERVCRINDDIVQTLQACGAPAFVGELPDWDLRDIEDLEDEVFAERRKIEVLEQRIDAKRAAHQIKIAERVAAAPDARAEISTAPEPSF